MSLGLLVRISEDGPWCGTRPPGRPRPPHFREEMARAGGEVFGPVPDPWKLGSIEVGLYGAITMHQMGQLVSGPAAEGFATAASVLFDETCGTIPLSELIWILLHRPPPPPPQWLGMLTYAGETLAFAQATDEEALASSATRQIMGQLQQSGLSERAR